MCDPVSAGIGLTVASSGLSAFGAYKAGQAEYDYNKYLAANNRAEAGLVQKQGELNAGLASKESAENLDLVRKNASQIEGAQKAVLGANMGGGSVTAQDLVSDTYSKSKLDEMTIKYNADLKAWRALNEASLKKWALEEQAKGYEYAGKNARYAGKIGAFSSLIGGATQVANMKYNQNMFMPKKGS